MELAKGNRSQACYNCGEVGLLSANCPQLQAPRAQRIRRILLPESRSLIFKLVESLCEYVKVICIKLR